MQRRLLLLSLFAAHCLVGASARADQIGDAPSPATAQVAGIAEHVAVGDAAEAGLAGVAGGEVPGELLLTVQRLNRDAETAGVTRVSQRIEPILAATPDQAFEALKRLANSPAAALLAIAIISMAALSRRNRPLIGDEEVGEDR